MGEFDLLCRRSRREAVQVEYTLAVREDSERIDGAH